MSNTIPGSPPADVLPWGRRSPVPPFDGMDAEVRAAFVSVLEWFTLQGNVTLFEENEPSAAF